MKKIKTFNKLLSSLTLLSPLSGIGFNSQYQNTQKVITENCFSFNNYTNLNAEPVQMGDIWVTVNDVQMGDIWVTVNDSDPTIITGYSSGDGDFIINENITQIDTNSFSNKKNITSLDLSYATNLTSIFFWVFC